jgi:hypothetical protein
LLPHRQLRNIRPGTARGAPGLLPHRQLRSGVSSPTEYA